MKREISIAIFVILLFSVIQFGSKTAIAHEENETDDDHHHMHGDDFGDFWWGIGMFVMMFGGFLFLIFLFTFLIKGETPQKSHTIHNGTSVLDERYARGEISRDEYLKMKADMKK